MIVDLLQINPAILICLHPKWSIFKCEPSGSSCRRRIPSCAHSPTYNSITFFFSLLLSFSSSFDNFASFWRCCCRVTTCTFAAASPPNDKFVRLFRMVSCWCWVKGPTGFAYAPSTLSITGGHVKSKPPWSGISCTL